MKSGMNLMLYVYFLMFCSAMTFSPGPMTLFLLGQGLGQKKRNLLSAQLGASTAYLLSILIFAAGFSVILTQSTALMKVIQFAGASYLLYLAYKQWTGSAVLLNPASNTENKQASATGMYMKGLLTGLSNPKTIILFSSVFPRFLTNEDSYLMDLFIIGLTFLLCQFASGCCYAYCGRHVQRLISQPGRQKYLQRTIAILLIGIAALLLRPI